MQTRKSKDIPEEQWGGVPDLSGWVQAANAARKGVMYNVKIDPVEITTEPRLAGTFKPINENYREHFDMARGREMYDIGSNGNLILVALAGGLLTVEFIDATLEIVPHRNGEVIDYHTLTADKLKDVFAYEPTASTIESRILTFQGQYANYEYLISPTVATLTLAFHLEFEEHHA